MGSGSFLVFFLGLFLFLQPTIDAFLITPERIHIKPIQLSKKKTTSTTLYMVPRPSPLKKKTIPLEWLEDLPTSSSSSIVSNILAELDGDDDDLLLSSASASASSSFSSAAAAEVVFDEARTKMFLVGEEEDGMRVDKFLCLNEPEQSRSYIGSLIDCGYARLDGWVHKERKRGRG